MSQLHGQYFDDNTPTDVITFNLGDEDIESEIYIGWETALEQSKQYQVSLENEILRLMIHGILHLKGMNDDTEDQMIVMKQEEDRLLNILQLRIENNA